MFNDQYDNNNVVMYLLPRRHQNPATKLEADRRNAKKNQSKQAITMTPEVKSCSMFLAIKNKENRNEKHKTMIITSADAKCKERLRKPGNKAVSVFSGPFV